jgi:hypothetical protein
VAYLSTDLGVLAPYFYFVGHTTYCCMDAIRLNGNAWINCLYASVSVSCESMIGHTADLGSYHMVLDYLHVTHMFIS